jgi:hypothetical protein
MQVSMTLVTNWLRIAKVTEGRMPVIAPAFPPGGQLSRTHF